MKISDFILKEKTRGDCYRFLSACFYQPQKELFLQEKLFENLTAALKEICPDAVISSDRMKSAVLNCSDEELSVEYARLFMGPFELVAPPYGSVYLDGARQVMGDSTVETMKMYEAAGLSMDNEFKELPDHITVELEFMNFLIYKEIEAIEKSDFSTALNLIKVQELFLDKFLKRW
ncbi:MAG: molecular chaperone TorD family protein, partial [Bacteroidota bacterium]